MGFADLILIRNLSLLQKDFKPALEFKLSKSNLYSLARKSN